MGRALTSLLGDRLCASMHHPVYVSEQPHEACFHIPILQMRKQRNYDAREGRTKTLHGFLAMLCCLPFIAVCARLCCLFLPSFYNTVSSRIG